MFIIGLSIILIILIKDLIDSTDPVYREMYYILSW